MKITKMGKSIKVADGLARLILLVSIISLIASLLIACGPEKPAPAPQEGTMKITSPVFQEGEAIPVRYSCDGENISPELNWSGAPEETLSFALITDDPDAPGGTFTHWIIFNVQPDNRGLPEAVPGESQPDDGALQGENDFGNIGYDGPCPPRGARHHYHFTLYALDQNLDLPAGATKSQVLKAIQGHILAQAELVATFQR
ncbi:YbhB/YbcL family Raf kinase inhibitor-like protein [Chloroflexota bacterium]